VLFADEIINKNSLSAEYFEFGEADKKICVL
jgi:hypothetical protein